MVQVLPVHQRLHLEEMEPMAVAEVVEAPTKMVAEELVRALLLQEGMVATVQLLVGAVLLLEGKAVQQ